MLSSADHDRIDAVVSACEHAQGLRDLRERVLDGLATWLDYRLTTFFVAPAFRDVFDDRTPVTHGLSEHVVNAYHERFRHADPFRAIVTEGSVRKAGPVSLDQLYPLTQISHRDYAHRFLIKNDIRAKIVVPVQGTGTMAGIGLLASESGSFGERDLALAGKLALRLSAFFRLWSGVADPAGLAVLTARELEVCERAAAGRMDREIALDLHLGLHTVKDHLKQAYRKLGVRNRHEMALRLFGLRFTR
ncbi:helix-turn-helix transcriptional regulator [Nonomuraea sp. NPDC023979]|uniref:helix-turn-helix transcriptional regulator n=1 Tax=Nonomuraea sp. NPDC023979 TaxID=3154796 RepID=UPI00340DCBF0